MSKNLLLRNDSLHYIIGVNDFVILRICLFCHMIFVVDCDTSHLELSITRVDKIGLAKVSEIFVFERTLV